MKAIAFFSLKEKIQGTIIFEQRTIKSPVYITFNLKGFVPNSVHAIHIHEYGDLSQGCKSLGTHFNPYRKNHSHSDMGHVGDIMNNIQIDSKGNFSGIYKTNTISLCGVQKNCIIGRSIVIHQFPDDLGLMGIYSHETKTLELYREMSDKKLLSIYEKLGYMSEYMSELPSRNKIIEKLEKESITTGNASTRIAGAIIGHMGN